MKITTTIIVLFLSVAAASAQVFPPTVNFEVRKSKKSSSNFEFTIDASSSKGVAAQIKSYVFMFEGPGISGAATTTTLDHPDYVQVWPCMNGTYTFKVKVKDSNGSESLIASRKIKVKFKRPDPKQPGQVDPNYSMKVSKLKLLKS